MRSSLPIRVRVLGSLAIALAASATLAAAAVHAASPGPAACQEYSVCGGPTGPASGNPGTGGANVAAQKPAPPDTSGWVHLPLVDYPVTPAVAILAASVVGAGIAVFLAMRLRKRPRAAARPL